MNIEITSMEYKAGNGKRLRVDVTLEVKEQLVQFDRQTRSQMRQDRRYPISAVDMNMLTDCAMSPQTDISDLLVRMEDYERLYAAIKKLTEIQQRRLRMYYFSGLSYKEIAMLENVSPGAIHESVKQALKRLRTILS